MVPRVVRISTKGRRGAGVACASVNETAENAKASIHIRQPNGPSPLSLTFDIRCALARWLKSIPMTRPLLRSALTSALVLAAVAVLAPSCTKEKPTTAIIKVMREDGTVVPDAYVKLFADPQFPLGDPSRLNKEKYSDGRGEAEFDYSDFYEQGQSGFAVLDIICTFDTLVGEGIIKIEEEETNRETVIILPAQ